MTAFFNNIQIVPGFYPFASLLTSVILWALYRVFIHMKCQSRQAQLFITAGLCFVTASLFLKLTVWVETENPEMSKQNANIFVSETPVTPTVPSSFPTPILSPDTEAQLSYGPRNSPTRRAARSICAVLLCGTTISERQHKLLICHGNPSSYDLPHFATW